MKQQRDEQFTININLAVDLGLDREDRERLSRAVNKAFVDAARGLRVEINRLLQTYGLEPDDDPDIEFDETDGPDTAAAIDAWISGENG